MKFFYHVVKSLRQDQYAYWKPAGKNLTSKLFILLPFLALLLISSGPAFNRTDRPESDAQTTRTFETLSLSSKDDCKLFFKELMSLQDSLSVEDRLRFAKKGFQSTLELNDGEVLYDFAFILSMYHYTQSDFQKGIDVLRKAEKYLLEDKERHAFYLSCTQNMLSIGYSRLSINNEAVLLLEQARENLLTAIDLGQKPQEELHGMLSFLEFNTALRFSYLGDNANAITCLKRNNEILRTHLKEGEDKQNQLGASLLVLSENFLELGQLDSAKYYLKLGKESITSLDTTEDRHMQFLLHFNYYTIVSFEAEYGSLDEARKYYEKASRIAEANPPEYARIALTYLTYAGQNDKAKPYLDIVLKQESLDNPGLIHLAVMKYYENEANYEKSYQASREFWERRKQAMSNKKSQYAAYIHSKYELDRKEKANALLKAKEEVLLRRYQLAILFASVMVILAAGLFYVYRQNRQKQNFLKKDLENQRLIAKQAKELQENAAAKEIFFTNAAHEIRTPLTLLKGPLSILSRHIKPENKNGHLIQLMKEASSDLEKKTNELLRLTAQDNTKLKADLHQITVKGLLDYIDVQFSPLAAYQDIKFEVVGNVPDLQIVSDPEKLETILKNLLSNAFKFTAPGGKVILECTENDESLYFNIKDSGVGINKEDLPFIFDRFFQTHKVGKVNTGGSGIGLSICKEYAELMNGNLQVESIEDQGSVFKLSLPIRHHKSTENTYPEYEYTSIIEEMLPTRTILSKDEEFVDFPHLLIVEDNLKLCQYLEVLLGEDYRLTFAYNGKEAISKIESDTPDLIISDLMMPVMDGYEMIKEIRKTEEFRLIPVLMLTAQHSLEKKKELLLAGIDDYLTKPFDAEMLKTHIDQLLDWSEMREDARTSLELDYGDKDMREEDVHWLQAFESVVMSMMEGFDLNLDNVSRSMNISKMQLSRKTKAIVGMTPKKYIQELRFQEARKWLIEGKFETVKAVSYSLGFKSEKYFARCFKKRFGKYPSELMIQKNKLNDVTEYLPDQA